MLLLPSHSLHLAALACATLLTACSSDTPATATVALPTALLETHSGWPHYGGDLGGTRFSAQAQITPANVDQLQLAWTYNSGDLAPESVPDSCNSPAMQVTPILARGTLYLCAPRNQVIALDPATGSERWHFDADPGAC